MRIIASYSIKGGVGKTALAVNLAYAFQQKGWRTLLIDLDPQGAAAFYFQVAPARKVKTGKSEKLRASLWRNIQSTDYPGLDIIPSNLSFRNLDLALDGMKKSKKQLRRILATFEDDYDAVILDCPPNITLLSENILHAADTCVVPVIPTMLSERTLVQLLKFFCKLRLPTSKIMPFFSMVQSVNKIHAETMERLVKVHPFLKTVIPQCVDIEKMGLKRQPVMSYASPKSRAAAYRNLCDELIVSAG